MRSQKAYTFVELINNRMVRLRHEAERRNQGVQIWTLCQLRKSNNCSQCGDTLHKNDNAYRPTTNGSNRMERICIPCKRTLAGQEVAK